MRGTRLADPAFRRQLAAGGLEAIEKSDDPMIQLARVINPEARRIRKITEELDEQDRQAYASVAEARFAVLGTSVYPDATFTLRLAFGPVTGYEQDGQQIPAW
ncbi:MAG: S46 family peptidase [Planctomycetaceae bacterium]